MKALKELLKRVIYGLFRMFPIRKNNILFIGYYGAQYSGSPKYISIYIQEHSDMKCIWAFTDCTKHPEYKGKRIHYGGIRFLFSLATSGTIVTNYRMPLLFARRQKQKYIQTWHSSLRLKMIEADAESTLQKHYIKMAKHDSKQITHLLVGSLKSKEIFDNAFWYDGNIECVGTPQCDLFFQDSKKYRQKVLKYFGLADEAKVILYAPTFRKNNDISIYNLEFDKIVQALENRFDGKWCFLVRLHPHLIGKQNLINYSKTIIQATEYDDVQELICAADMLLTDYSAVMFDFALTRKKCILYVPDLKEYTLNDRNLYFLPHSLPFPCVEEEMSLVDAINKFDEHEYNARLDSFLREIGSFDDGKSCERVFNIIGEK